MCSVYLPWDNLSTWHQVGLLSYFSPCEQRAPRMGNLFLLTDVPAAFISPVYSLCLLTCPPWGAPGSSDKRHRFGVPPQ